MTYLPAYLPEGKCIHDCKRSRTDRSSIRIDWDHMFSESSIERFVFRARTGPLCPSECSKIQFCGHHEKTETVIETVSVCVFDVCGTNFIYPMNRPDEVALGQVL
jgi:hypothetical protein